MTSGSRAAAQLFLLVLVGMLPALALLAASDSIAASLTSLGEASVRLAVVVIAFVWAAVVSAVGATVASRETSTMLAAAERRDDEADDAALGRLGEVLRRRDRQLQRLAADAANAPVTQGASQVAAHVVRMARHVTEDHTWVLAVHGDTDQPLPGVYDGEETGPPTPVADLHKWAAVTGSSTPAMPTVATGPWGAFLLLHLPGGDGYRAQLLAPWEGRAQPSGADESLLSLIAQHAGVTLNHASLYARVNAQASELERLSAVQRDFLRGVTHDLQSPLASIGATATDLRERGEPVSADAELRTIRDQADRLQRMVTQLLTMSGLEAGVVQPRSEVFRAGPVVDRVIGSVRAPERSLVHVPSGPDRLAVGDADRFEQVVWALVDNAIKYTPAGGTIELRTQLVDEPQGSFEELTVSDNGIGMDAETLERAFDQFYRAENARRVAPNGSGIGLFTAKGLVELMGGSIVAESALGSGTRIRVRLPAEVVDVPGLEPA